MSERCAMCGEEITAANPTVLRIRANFDVAEVAWLEGDDGWLLDADWSPVCLGCSSWILL